MEPNPYAMDTEVKPAHMKERMHGIAKSLAGIYLFNKLRKASKLDEPEDYDFSSSSDDSFLDEEPAPAKNIYVFYDSGIMLVNDMLNELYDRYMEYCPSPDPDVIDRAMYVFSLMNYVRGVEEENGTEA